MVLFSQPTSIHIKQFITQVSTSWKTIKPSCSLELAGVCGDVFHKNSEWAPEVDVRLAVRCESNTYYYPSLQVWFRNSRDTHDWDQRQVTVLVHKLGLGSQLR